MMANRKKPNICEQLAVFIEHGEHVRNTWLKDSHLEIYVRHGRRILAVNGEPTRCETLDIANIHDTPARHRGKGYWKEFITTAERINPWDAVYVENIFPLGLREQLFRHGYLVVYPGRLDGEGCVSMYKMKT